MRGDLIRITTEGFDPSMDNPPKVNVLMSTYNGEKYIEEQISSIAGQNGVKVNLLVRDDGSNDDTLKKLCMEFEKNPGSIVGVDIRKGSNIGSLLSFEELIRHSGNADYYAFSDQDDVWRPAKLQQSISQLRHYSKRPALYASAVDLVNELLEPLSKNRFVDFEYSIPSELIRHRLAGHTMVWNSSLQNMLERYNDMPVWTHDQHVVLVCLLAKGTLILDNISYVAHRRLETSITPGNGSAFKRITHEMKFVFNAGHRYDRRRLSNYILDKEKGALSDEERSFLELVADNRTACNRARLCMSKMFDCGVAIGNIEGKLSVALGRF